MKLSANARKAIAAGALAVAVAAGGWLMRSGGDLPSRELLRLRAEAVINLGWNFLHAEEITVDGLERGGKGCRADLSYMLVLDRDEAQLAPEQAERFRRFLPMCADVELRRGNRCFVRESMIFVDTETYGWMPEPLVQLQPQALPLVAGYGKNGTAP